MRCDQHIGLTQEAKQFLLDNIPKSICPHCLHISTIEVEEIGHFYGMYDSTYPLHRHELKDGGHADEYLQCSPWSSGPMFFTGLKVYDKTGKHIRTFEWTDEEIEEYC